MQKPSGWAAFQAVLRSWDSDKLSAAARAIEDFKASQAATIFRDVLESREGMILNPLIDQPQVYEQSYYARQTGMVSGMRQMNDLAECILYAWWEREAQLAQAEHDRASGQVATNSPR